MNTTLRKYGILSVHQLVKKHSQRICIVFRILSLRSFLELLMVKIRHIGLVFQSLSKPLRHRSHLSYLRYSIIDIHIFDVKHIKRRNSQGVDILQRLNQTDKNKLNVVLFQLNIVSLQTLYITLDITVVSILTHRYPVVPFLVMS